MHQSDQNGRILTILGQYSRATVLLGPKLSHSPALLPLDIIPRSLEITVYDGLNGIPTIPFAIYSYIILLYFKPTGIHIINVI